MSNEGAVRVDPQPPPEPARRWTAPVAAGVVVLVIAALVGLGSFEGPGTAVPEETIPDLGPDPLEAAVLVVEEFALAWNRGDTAAADGMILEDWESVVLPGFVDSRFVPRDGRERLTDGIGFLTAASRLALGPCDAEIAHPDSRATAVVACRQASFEGDYLEAIRRNIWEEYWPASATRPLMPGIVFEIQRDRIVGIDLDIDWYAPQAYCIWAERARPEAASLFDLHCRPTTAPGDGAAHAELAEAFMTAGAPLPSERFAEARLAASYVDRFVEFHNVADTATAGSWLSEAVTAADLPGFPGSGVEPAIADYLPWSARLLRIETGECTVEPAEAETIVTCPEMAVDGPLVGEPLPQPTRFTVAANRMGNPIARGKGRILGVEPLTDDEVPVGSVCRGIRSSDPSTAALAFTGDCRPVYTEDAAEALAAVLGDG